MKNKTIILIALTFVLILSGCSSKAKDTSVVATNSVNSSEDTSSDTENASEIDSESESENESDTSNETPEIKYYAPYTGEEVSKETLDNPAYMVSIENSGAARPQAGFTSADIIYELMAEGGVTRCFALFQKDNAEKIGPVRSTRTYFIDLAYEYNVPFAHCGGSHDALDRISREKPMSMNEMYNPSYFFRDKSVKAKEHGLFTTSDKLLKFIEVRNYIKPTNVELKFDKIFWDNSNLENANSLSLKFNKYYRTSYTFKDGLYYKSMNGKDSLNRHDDVPVAIKNIVIQNVKYSSRSGEPYLDAKLVGNGDGIIISNGKSIKVTWSKKDLKSQTIFKDENGDIVPLNVGKTWWHILDQKAQLTIS
ncbi:hypothetical protein SH2C18_37300 [Clostridium sediminicola]|uniref:DUF3048 domain-containing protein n=1 Tax=Clostridium sediminicola TaxID=3114879 RepID=UPI0031F20F49